MLNSRCENDGNLKYVLTKTEVLLMNLQQNLCVCYIYDYRVTTLLCRVAGRAGGGSGRGRSTAWHTTRHVAASQDH